MALPQANFMTGFGTAGTAVTSVSVSQTLKVLPAARWGSTDKPVVSRDTLDSVATSPEDRQLTVAAESATLRVTYGRDRLGAQVADVLLYGTYWVIVAVWGEGPIDAVENLTLNDLAAPSGVVMTHYTGAAGQTADATLVAAYGAQSPAVTYSDALAGVAYSVIKVPTALISDFPLIAATIRGRLLYDPRTTLTTYSANPALALADFLSNTTYGAGRTVDWSTVGDAADACDELVQGTARRAIGLTLDAPQDPYAWGDVLRAYTSCWIIPGGSGLRLIVDRPSASVADYDHDDGNIMGISPLQKRSVMDAPTVMIIRYTDTSVTPWKEALATVNAAGVLDGTTPRRVSEVRMQGIQSASQAMREAIERLNKLTLSDLTFTLDVRDLGVALEPGDVVTVTHPVGLGAKAMRVMSATGADGRYTLTLAEYDAASYSDSVVTDPSTADTNLPDPGEPTPVTSFSIAEEVYQQQIRTYSSRIRATWAAPSAFPLSFINVFRINVIEAGVVVFTGTAPATATTWATPSVQEGKTYQVDVLTISRTGASSTAASATLVALGKQLPPGDVPGVTGFEVGGEVRLQWEPAIDLDIWRYEIRYVAVDGTWEDSILLDRTDGLRLTTKDVPAGTWDFLVKAIDSVGNYSGTAARRTIIVTVDAGAFVIDTTTFDTPTLTNMREYRLTRIDTVRRFSSISPPPVVLESEISDLDGVVTIEDWVALEDDLAVTAGMFARMFPEPLGTYTEPLSSYYTGAAEFLTEVHDYGEAVAGNWSAELSWTSLTGSPTRAMEVSDDAVTYDVYSSLTAKRSGRFVRLRAACLTGEAFSVRIPTASVRVQAVAVTENGFSTSAASGPTTITLSGSYAAIQSLTLTPSGTTPVVAVYANIVIGTPSSFDVYIFDQSDTQIAAQFGWQWNGV